MQSLALTHSHLHTDTKNKNETLGKKTSDKLGRSVTNDRKLIFKKSRTKQMGKAQKIPKLSQFLFLKEFPCSSAKTPVVSKFRGCRYGRTMHSYFRKKSTDFRTSIVVGGDNSNRFSQTKNPRVPLT